MLWLINPVSGPSRGMLFSAASIFVVVVWDSEPNKELQIILELDVYIPFFLLICVGMCKWL